MAKEIEFHGTAKRDIRGFPDVARRLAGHQLDKVQRGEEPDDWKPMPAIGSGVKEVRIATTDGAFRVIYLETLPDAVHVYHAFQKKTQKTAKRDIDLAKRRYDAHRRLKS
jgi:phage-related protein